jgi:hypothetical protein
MERGESELPGELLAKLLRLTDLGTILAARRAARRMRSPAGEAVEGLQAEEAQLPAEAWAAFPLARRLRTTQSRQCSDAEYVANLVQLMATLPRRLERLTIAYLVPPGALGLQTAGRAPQLAQALLASSCSATLAQLTIKAPISIGAASLLLSGLPALQRADLTVNATAEERAAAAADGWPLPRWRPTPQLAGARPALHLQCTAGAAGHYLDLSGLGVELKELGFSGFFFDLEPLSRLTRLERLSIIPPRDVEWEEDEEGASDLAALLELRQLSELRLPGAQLPARLWARLAAALPQLQTLEVGRLAIGAGAPPAAQLASMRVRCSGGLVLDEPGLDGLHGLLARQLPQLQELDTETQQLLELATALTGHRCLQRLHLLAPAQDEYLLDLAPPWPEAAASAAALGQMAASLPALQELQLGGYFGCSDALLQDLAGCGGLSSLVLMSDIDGLPEVGVAGMAALAIGPCGMSLQQLTLAVEVGLQARAVAQLLRPGRMAALREVTVAVQLPGSDGLGSNAQAAEALLALLAQQEGVAPGRVRGCEVRWRGLGRRDVMSCRLELLGA